jgi:hypothetical protein
MKTIILIGCAVLLSVSISAQTFTRAEYFFDTDPGLGNGTSIALAPSGETITFTANIPTNSLAPGFHTLGLRIQQADLIWGLFETRGFYLSQSTAASPNITEAEYFFDSDPGQGNATPIPVTAGATVNFTIPISTAALTTGFHFLTIRAKSAGVWGNFETRGFYLSTATTPAANISGAEYFFDTDPGQGNATAISVTAGASANFTINVPTTGLSTGFHFLTIRAKSNGLWGNFETRGFYISQETTAAADITDAEYFFDVDPGVGNGTPLTISSGGTSNFTVSLPATGLSAGFHLLAIRTKGSDGRWGQFDTRGFYIASGIGNAADIVAAEYFFDTDPGIGNGSPLIVNPTGGTIAQTFTIPVPITMASGPHTVSIRVMDSDGVWSELETGPFTISVNNPPVAVAGADQVITLPVSGVTLDGSASTDTDGTIATYSWTQVSGPTSATITDSAAPATTVEDLTEGVYEFQLMITDDGGFSDTDLIQVTVNPEPNEPPAADAGPDQVIILPTNSVTLSGTSSADPDGTIVSYNWTKLTGPSSYNIVTPGAINTDVTNLVQGQYQFQLTVTDNRGATNADIVLVTVNESGCPPIPAITQSDHLLICNPPGDSYKWFRNGEEIAGETGQILEISLIEYGTYTVELTDNSCSSTSPGYTYVITDAEGSQPIYNIHPNPVRDFLYVTMRPDAINRNFLLIDPLGRKALNLGLTTGENIIRMSDLASGIYYVVIEGKSFYKIQKL